MLIDHRLTPGILLVLIAIAASDMVAAQESEDPIAAFRSGMQSPTAASLGRHGDIPVNLHTGGVTISIPLFEVQGRSLSLPLTLTYQSSGLKVSETAGWVGTGWSLDAGGVITRSVRGLPDDSQHGYVQTGHRLYEASVWDDIQNGEFPKGGTTWQYLEDVRTGNADPEPDRFFYNIPGQSGQFIVPPQNTQNPDPVRPIPYAPISISTPEGYNLWDWEVIDATGTRYAFSSYDAEATTSLNLVTTHSDPIPLPNPQTYLTSWYLSEMTSANDADTFSFTYTTHTTKDRTPHAHTRRHIVNYAPPLGGDCSGVNLDTYSWSYITTDGRLLQSISSSEHFVEFHTSVREDALNPDNQNQQHHRLDAITIRRGGQSGPLVKRFDFSYTYYGTGDAKRLFLTEVRESGVGGLEAPPRQFEYHTAGVWPSRYSTAQDHWGYYNGANNGAWEMVPLTTFDYYTTPLDGADREPSSDPAVLNLGMLKRIQYPTGGWSELEYEPHTYRESPAGYGHATTMASTAVAACQGSSCTEPPAMHDTFTVTAHDGEPRLLRMQFEIKPHSENAGYGRVSIVRLSDNQEVWYADTCQPGTGGDRCHALTQLHHGEYKIAAEAYDVGSEQTEAWINPWWTNTTEDLTAQAGGMRIARLEHHSAGGAKQVVRYEYEFSDEGPLVSSGYLVNFPHYDIHLERTNCEIFQRTSSPRGPLGTTQGSHIGYTRVRELHGEGLDNGWTEHHFRFGYDVDLVDGGNHHESNTAFLFTAATSQAWQRGQSIQSVTYDSADRVVMRTERLHHFAWSEAVHYYPYRALVVSVLQVPLATGQMGEDLRIEYFARYHVLSAWARLEEEHVTRFNVP